MDLPAVALRPAGERQLSAAADSAISVICIQVKAGSLEGFGYGNVALFEVGPEFYGRKPGEQNQVAAGVRCGMTAKKDWNGSARAHSRSRPSNQLFIAVLVDKT